MSLRGYIKKGKAAGWTIAFPCQVSQKKELVKFVRQISKKRQITSPEYTKLARRLVMEAIERGETCPVVNSIPELKNGHRYGWPISNKLNEIHHMRGRLGPLLIDIRGLMVISKAGHRWCHQHVKEARERGWFCQPGEWNQPFK